MTTTSYVTTALNTLLTQIQDEQFTVECPTGTLSNVDISECPISFSGTYGNTTTDGYYATYTISIDKLINLLNLQLTSQLFSPSNITSTNETITDNFTFAYVDSLTLSGIASGSGEVYIPEYSSSECIVYGTNGGCQKYETYSQASTYNSANLVPYTSDFTLTVNGITGSGTMQYTIATSNPDISGNTTYTVYVYIPGEQAGVFYIYNIEILDTTASFTSYDLTGNIFYITNSQVQEFLTYFAEQIKIRIGGIYTNYTFQFIVNSSS